MILSWASEWIKTNAASGMHVKIYLPEFCAVINIHTTILFIMPQNMIFFCFSEPQSSAQTTKSPELMLVTQVYAKPPMTLNWMFLLCYNFSFLFRFVSFRFLLLLLWGSWGCYCFYPLFSRGRGGYWDQFRLTVWAKARGHPGGDASSSQDPQFWGSVSCSRILRHVV